MVRSLIPAHEFRSEPWDSLQARAEDLATSGPGFDHLPILIRSIRESGVDHMLAAHFAMSDLNVTSITVAGPPVERIVVLRPTSPSGLESVRIEHRSVSGRDDSVERHASDAVPLFWRFVWEKFGITPDNAKDPDRGGSGP